MSAWGRTRLTGLCCALLIVGWLADVLRPSGRAPIDGYPPAEVDSARVVHKPADPPPPPRTPSPPAMPPPKSAADSRSDASCADKDELPASAKVMCSHALGGGSRLREYGKGQPMKWTLVITTYKGHKTLHNTLRTWRQSGLLQHPDLEEAIVHVNKCRCADVDHLKKSFADFAPDLRLRILCVSANRIHPQALLAAIGSVRTPFAMLSENDRPTIRRTGESTEELRARVGGVLDLSLRTAARPDTPFVLIHRFFLQSRDMKAYREWKQKQDAGINATLPPEVTRPHQYEGKPWQDTATCWTECMKRVLAADDPAKLRKIDEDCQTIQKTPGARFCEKAVCLENSLWSTEDGGTGALSGSDPMYREMMCAPVWMQGIGTPKWFAEKRLKYTNFDPLRPLQPFVYCTKSAHWVNAPQIFRTKWYLEDIVGFMCRNRRNIWQSGLTLKPKKKYFGHYGRAMEDFNIKWRAGGTVCHADGITDHMELEDYFGTAL